MQIFKKIFLRITILSLFVIVFPLTYVSSKIYTSISSACIGLLPDNEITKLTGNITVLVGLTYFIAIVLFLICVFFIISRKLSPLKKILTMSRKLATGDLSVKLKSTSNDELGELTRSINHMKDRLQYSMVKLKNSYEREKQYREDAENANELKTVFLDKVSEELNAPLKPIINYSNVIISQINKGDYDETLEKKIRIIRDCADNMLNITSNLNEVSRLEAGKIELNRNTFDTSIFIEELVNLHHYSATNRGLLLKTIYSQNFPKFLHTDKEILFHILSNILAYTIQYSTSSSEITITSESNENNILFLIENNVPGTQIEIISEIFQKSNERISNMSLHLSNARLFGLVSAISNTDFLNGCLEAEVTHKNSVVFRLVLDKSLTTPRED
jgi:signal transduction histidine kinase